MKYKSKPSIIRNCRIILNISPDINITDNDVEKFKKVIHSHLYEDLLSPKQIATKYGIQTDQFHVFISKTLGIKLRNCRDASRNLHMQLGTTRTDDKEIYRYNCRFTFIPHKEKNIIGYELLSLGKFATPQNKIDGEVYLHRDHMVSVSYGYENNIDPKIISHPANCQILLEKDNLIKNSGCSITIEQLKDRIEKWENNDIVKIEIKTESKKVERSKKHIDNIKKSAMERVWFNDGTSNFLSMPKNKKKDWIEGKINFSYIDYINVSRLKLGFSPIPLSYKQSLIDNKRLVEKTNYDFLKEDFLEDAYIDVVLSLKEFMAKHKMYYYNNFNRKLISSFLKLIKENPAH